MSFEERLIYYGGLFDGEGCVHARIYRYDEIRADRNNAVYSTRRIHAFLTVTQFDLRPLEMLQSDFGGTIRLERQCKPTSVWKVSQEECSEFGRAILPYTVVKRVQLEHFLKLRKLIDDREPDFKEKEKLVLAVSEAREWML